MPLDFENNPMFRKTFVSWYDSNAVCIAAAFFMLVISLFAIVGIRVAISYQEPWIVWVPSVLLLLSAAVLISLAIRLTRRRTSMK